MYIVIAIRGYPDLPIGWRDSYYVGQSENIVEAKRLAREEVQSRGGKYGCVGYFIGQTAPAETTATFSVPRFEYRHSA